MNYVKHKLSRLGKKVSGRHPVVITIVFSAVLLPAMLFVTTQRASAAPNCYERYGGTNSNILLNYECTTYGSFAPVISGASDPNCYVIDYPATEGAGSPSAPTKGDCASLQFGDKVLPKCYQDANSAGLQFPVSCDAARAAAPALKVTMSPGKCYVVGQVPKAITEVDCSKYVPPGAIIGGSATAGSGGTSAPTSPVGPAYKVAAPVAGKDTCGSGDNAVSISIDIGCVGKGNPILDMTFAILRFLSIGVGLVIVASMIVAGIQYTSSRGDPQATAKAITRITSNVGALLLFIFIYAILNWLIPAGLLK